MRTPHIATNEQPDIPSGRQEGSWIGAEEGSVGGRVEEQKSFVASTPVESMTDFSKPINIAIESMPGSGEVCCATHFCSADTYDAAQRHS